MVRIGTAATDEEYACAARLFAEYAASLEFDLSFQDFDRELATLREQYSLPAGCLLLAERDGAIVGCVGVRRLGDAICEMKRLYVQLASRGHGIGRALAESAIRSARQLGYERMRLDTVVTMEVANRLYEALGFEEIGPYRENPLEEAVFLELKL